MTDGPVRRYARRWLACTRVAILGVALLGACLGVPAAASAAPPAATPTPAHIARTIAIRPDTPIFINVTEGTVRVVGEARRNVAIDMTRTVSGGRNPAGLPLVVTKAADGVHVTAVQPHDPWDPDLRATVVVRVPERALLKSIEVFEGAITLTNLHGTVMARIVRGPIDASRLSGTVRLATRTGSVTLDAARLTPGGVLNLRTFNGNVHLGLAVTPPNARILAVTYRGHVQSTLPLRMKDQFGPRFGEATLGTGKPPIWVTVVWGDIDITAPVQKAPSGASGATHGTAGQSRSSSRRR